MEREKAVPCGEVLRHLAGKLAAAGGRPLLVGGCVRDELLGIPGKDFDLEVYGMSLDGIRRTLEPEFALDFVGASFGVLKVHHYDIDIALPRVENKIGAGHKGFDVRCVPDLSFAEAAGRRDFTVNAIMKDPLTGELIDPWHGQEDLRRGILRHVTEHFGEDPLRVLRGMQFAARFQFRAAPETAAVCAGLSQAELPKERLAAEWEKMLLKGTKPSLGLEFLRECGWVRFYPELAALIGCPQSPHWHPEGDVWRHTLGVVDAAADRRHYGGSGNLILMLAALGHDFGKPGTTVTDDRGRIVSPGHADLGPEIADRFIRRIWDRNDLAAVLPLIRRHMQPLALVRGEAQDRTYRHLALEVTSLEMLADLAASDILGVGAAPEEHKERLAEVEQFRRRAKELQIAAAKPSPLILGRHLLARGIPAGPGMKPLLDRCFAAQLDGEFSDLAGGLSYLDRLLP